MQCMTVRFLLFSAIGFFGGLGVSEAQCEPDGEVQFACGPISPEDLAAVPESPWVIASSMEVDGYCRW